MESCLREVYNVMARNDLETCCVLNVSHSTIPLSTIIYIHIIRLESTAWVVACGLLVL